MYQIDKYVEIKHNTSLGSRRRTRGFFGEISL